MITLFLSVFLASAHAQSSYPGSTLLRDLPDGAVLQVIQQVELDTVNDDSHGQMLHYCTFEDGECSQSMYEGFPAAFHSQLNLKTDVEDALEIIDSGVFSGNTYALRAGTYCLSRKSSSFHSDGMEHTDKLKFTDCAGNNLFTIYVNAGYNLRNGDNYHGYTISEFNFQAGKYLRFVK
jgi:hypothetical protein